MKKITLCVQFCCILFIIAAYSQTRKQKTEKKELYNFFYSPKQEAAMSKLQLFDFNSKSDTLILIPPFSCINGQAFTEMAPIGKKPRYPDALLVMGNVDIHNPAIKIRNCGKNPLRKKVKPRQSIEEHMI